MLALLLSVVLPAQAGDDTDPHLWLEEVEGTEALDWVRARNEVSVGAISADDSFETLRAELLAIYDSDDRIPYVSQQGERYINFWRDGEHPRGVWRQTTLDSYRTDSPEWETLLDLDALAEEEDENWVWGGSTCLYPSYDRCLVRMSRGGADAVVVREFDVTTRQFVQGGFELPEAKQRIGWIDRDHLYVGTDFGEGSLTDSGYPRIVKVWTRGTPLDSAETLFEGEAADIAVSAYRDPTPGYERDFVYRGLTFYTNEVHYRSKKGLVRVDKPDSADFSADKQWAYVSLRDDWEVDGTTYAAGSLLVADFKKFMKGKRDFTVLFEPSDTTSLSGWTTTKSHVILNVLDDVKNRLTMLTPGKTGWTEAPVPGAPELGTVTASAMDPFDSDAVWLYVSDFLTPSTLAMSDLETGESETLKQLPALFDADGLEVSQHFVTSDDGTRVPYFQVSQEGLELDGSNPTLLYGYGGFEVSLLPRYSSRVGAGWLERGGVYVLANIRGGGEYGPRWHQAALRENRFRAYEDFAAVGRDLVERGVTSREHLGIQGGSNGGLLMGNMYTLYPELWGAIVCQVPLLDMKRYTQLLAGASWAGEYGDPDDPDDWAFIEGFSPYHNLDAEADTPPMLITTSTRDDRVHPGHARKMKAALEELGRDDVLYYENIEGGHGGAANNEQAAFMGALAYTFLWRTLNGEPVLPPAVAEEGEDAEDDASQP